MSHEADLVISAARQGDAPKLKELLERGLNYNVSNYGHETPLYVAAREGHLECVEILLTAAWKEFSSAEDIVDFVCQRNSALSVAAKNGHWRIIDALVNLYSGCIAEKTGFALHKACQSNNVKCIEILVKNFPAHLKEIDYSSLLPIHIAAECCGADGMKILFDGGADLSAQAIVYHTIPTCPELLIFPFCPELRVQIEITPFHLACKAGNTDVVNFLIEKNVDINATETGGFTPLYYATVYNRLDVLQILLNHGAKPCLIHGEDGISCPITNAARLGNLEVVKMLANIAKDECGTEAVLHAMHNWKNNFLEYLFKSGFDRTYVSSRHCLTWYLNLYHIKGDKSRTLEILLEHNMPLHKLAKYDATSTFSIFPNKLHLLHINCLRNLFNYGLAELQSCSQSRCNFKKLVKETVKCFHDAKFDEISAFGWLNDDMYVDNNFLAKLILYQKYFPNIKFSCEDSTLLSDTDNWHERFVPAVGTLTELCRWTIRRSIVQAHGSVACKHVSCLSLPTSLKNFVLYKNETCYDNRG